MFEVQNLKQSIAIICQSSLSSYLCLYEANALMPGGWRPGGVRWTLSGFPVVKKGSPRSPFFIVFHGLYHDGKCRSKEFLPRLANLKQYRSSEFPGRP